MRIDDINGKLPIHQQQETARQGRSESKDVFELLLEKELSAVDKPSETPTIALETTGPSGMTGLLPGTAFQDISAVDFVPSGVLSTSDALLSRIESLIEGAEGRPRNMEGIVQALAKEAESLKAGLGSLPEGHPLKTVASEFEILAYVESIKWNRGDYL